MSCQPFHNSRETVSTTSRKVYQETTRFTNAQSYMYQTITKWPPVDEFYLASRREIYNFSYYYFFFFYGE